MPTAFRKGFLPGVHFGLCLAFWAGVVSPASAQPNDRIREPLPLDVAASLNSHNGRSPIDLSSDGEWVAHTYGTDATVPRDTYRYSATGTPFGEGDAHMQAVLTHTRTGEVIRLGHPRNASWAAAWSPDGQRVAFYSDEGNEAGLWIWDRATRSSKRIAGLIVRPFFGFEVPRWASDSQRLLCKVLPAGMTVAQANAFETDPGAFTTRFKKVGPNEASVFVLRADAQKKDAKQKAVVADKPEGDLSWAVADLALVDVRTGSATRLVERTAVRYYGFSPDNSRVVVSLLKGWAPNTQQPIYDLGVVEIAGRAMRRLAENVRLGYGLEWSWSPDGTRVAYLMSGQKTAGRIVVVTVADGQARTLEGRDLANFDPGEGEYAPLWDPDGEHLYAVGDGKLWRVNAASGDGRAFDVPDGWQIRSIVADSGQARPWGIDRGNVWVIAQHPAAQKHGIHSFDLATGRSHLALEEEKHYSRFFNSDASDGTHEIVFVSTDQQRLADIWILNSNDGKARQATHLNATVERYALGTAKIVEWRSMDGVPLRGALLLPPGYTPGRRLPMMVFVYGGANGSDSLNRFGFWGTMATHNMHILATRGYAVLFPDAPLGPGTPMADLFKTVIPGVNAAIEQGYADPDRLAIAGQSYGSYSTLAIITQTKRFKAAIITAAVLHPDLFSAYLEMGRDGTGSSIGYYERGQGNMGGSIWEYRDRYFNNSPIFLFDRIETPLLIGQGEKDGRLLASDAMFVALQRLGKRVEYRIYEGEGHVLTQKPNVLDFWKRRLDFLAEQLDYVADENGAVIFEGDRAKARQTTKPTTTESRR